jgi:transposase
MRGLIAEYGEVFGLRKTGFDAGIKEALARLAERLPAMLIDTLREQLDELNRLDERIARIEARLLAWLRQDRAARAIAEIPGVGLLTATAAVATMGQPKHSDLGVSSPPGSDWCQPRPEQVEKFDC